MVERKMSFNFVCDIPFYFYPDIAPMVESAKAVAMDIGNREKVEMWEEANGQVGQLNIHIFSLGSLTCCVREEGVDYVVKLVEEKDSSCWISAELLYVTCSCAHLWTKGNKCAQTAPPPPSSLFLLPPLGYRAMPPPNSLDLPLLLPIPLLFHIAFSSPPSPPFPRCL